MTSCDDETLPGAAVDVPGVPNLRDLGGWATRDGARVRRGVLFRSTALSRLDGPGAAAFGALGIRTVIDLRTAAERAAAPDRLPAGTALLELDVLADATDLAPARLAEAIADPALVAQHLGDGRAAALLTGAYRDLVTLPSARAGYGALLRTLLDPGAGPVLWHCTTGKDRTGWASAVTLLLLGVPEEDVRREFLLTNEQLLPALAPLLDRAAALGVPADVLRPLLGVDEAYLDAALGEVRAAYGTVERYAAGALGVDAAAQERLRERYVVT